VGSKQLPPCKYIFRYPSLPKPGTLFEDIPVVTEYKYLGLIVDQKLTLAKHLAFIEEKAMHQCATLWLLLKVYSLIERIKLCRSLFEMMIFPYFSERNKTNINKVHAMVGKTFKKYCLLKKNVNKETIENS